MRKYCTRYFPLLAFLLCLLTNAFAQTIAPGYIIRPCTDVTSTPYSGKQILDPNQDNYASANTAGFGTADIYNSEIPYKPIKAFLQEPNSDLRRGPNHLYSDYVPDSSSNGYYMYYDSIDAGHKYLLFRQRMGSIIPGAKGFSLLIDKDLKFGASGPNADPNYLGAVTSIKGNPGFEYELVLTTQGGSQIGLEIDSVDGTSDPVKLKTYIDYKNYSQISIASTSDNGDPDFYLDWYINMDTLTKYTGITSSTPIRLIGTTVMAPKPAIGGPLSDIYGLGDGYYKDPFAQYEAYINLQPSITISDWKTSTTTSPMGVMCTAAPTVNSPIGTGSVTVSGTWAMTNAAASKNTATITIYKNGVSTGVTVSVTSTGNAVDWTAPTTISVIDGDIITAKAQASGESACYTSNSVTASDCNSSTRPGKITNLAVSNKGADGGGWTSGHYVSLWRMTASGMVHIGHGIPGVTTNWTTVSGVTGGWAFSGGSAGNGNAKLDYGTYIAYDSIPGGCISAYGMTCNSNGNGGTTSGASPAITLNSSASISAGVTSISGTYTPVNASTDKVKVYVDSVYIGNATLNSNTWSYTFSGTSLKAGQVITVTGQPQETSNTFYCQSAVTATVTCGLTAPVITTDLITGKLSIGQTIAGTSAAPTGTFVKLYNASTNTLLATTTVQSNGSWTSGITAASGASYYAKDSSSATCVATSSTVSALTGKTSTSRCGTITAPATIYSTTTSLTVAYGASATSLTLLLYEDGQFVDSTAAPLTSGTSYTFDWSSTGNKLYAGNGKTTGILSIAVKENGPLDTAICPTTYKVVTDCSGMSIPVPSVSPLSKVIAPGSSVTYTVSNLAGDAIYSVSDSSTGNSLASAVWTPTTPPSSISMTTSAFSSSTKALINGMKMSTAASNAGEICYATPTVASVTVASVLPVTLADFKGNWNGKAVVLNWISATEFNTNVFEIERSADGVHFEKIGGVAAKGSATGAAYSFTDISPLATNYYRLRMLDFDGTYSYSKVVKLVDNGSVSYLNNVRPNPFTKSLTLSLTLAGQQSLRIIMLDGSGRQVKTMQVAGNRGLNLIPLNDLNGLRDGYYFIQVIAENEVLQQKVLKQSF